MVVAASSLLVASCLVIVPQAVGSMSDALAAVPGGAESGTKAPVIDAPAAIPTAAPLPAAAVSPEPTFSYVEEFDTPVALGRWPSNGSAPRGYSGFRTYPNGTSGMYYPSKVLSVHDGVLDWYCHGSMGAAVLPMGYSGFTYGTWTIRMRTDDFPEYHIAFLLWPNSNEWTHELDGPEEETTTGRPYPAVLLGTTLVNGKVTGMFAPVKITPTPESWHDAEFHDYTWQWGPDSVSFYQDGTLVTTVTQNVPHQAMHPVLQVQFANALQGRRPDPATTGHVYVDRLMYDPSYTIAIPTT